MIVHADLTPDDDGFTTQQCKNNDCERFFKVAFGKGSENRLAFCPYCKFEGGFWTVEQLKYFHCVAANKKAPDPEVCDMPDETNGPENQFEFPCHGESIKHDDSRDSLYCIICGEKHQIRTKSKSKKTKKPKR